MNLKEFKKMVNVNASDVKTIDGMEVIPFISLPAMDEIVEKMLEQHTIEDREMILVYGVLGNCTTIIEMMNQDEDDIDITYPEIVYSGFFDNIVNECPYIADAIKKIRAEVERKESFQYVLNDFVEKLANMVETASENIGGGMLDKAIEQFTGVNITEE